MRTVDVEEQDDQVRGIGRAEDRNLVQVEADFPLVEKDFGVFAADDLKIGPAAGVPRDGGCSQVYLSEYQHQ